MSLILDALRKMELERKAKRLSSQEIRAEVLNYRGTAAPSEKSRIVPVTVTLLLLVSAAAAGFLYLKRAEPPKIDVVRQMETPQQGPTPVMPPQPVMLTPPEPSVQKSLPKEVNTPVPPVKSSARPDATNQRNGDEGITVSGIAWQDERSLRRAVINGSLVGEGAEIQGAKIVEIRENRVRFSRGGELFEVAHTSGSGR